MAGTRLLLYGYGGYGVSLTPASTRRAASGLMPAASMWWRTCAAAANTASNGTRPAT